MKSTIKFSNGKPASQAASIQEAAGILISLYPDGVIYDAGGFEQNEFSSDEAYDIRSGRAAMAWLNEDEARDDDGTRAIAEITVEE